MPQSPKNMEQMIFASLLSEVFSLITCAINSKEDRSDLKFFDQRHGTASRQEQCTQQHPYDHPGNPPLEPEECGVGETGDFQAVQDTKTGDKPCAQVVCKCPENINNLHYSS